MRNTHDDAVERVAQAIHEHTAETENVYVLRSLLDDSRHIMFTDADGDTWTVKVQPVEVQ